MYSTTASKWISESTIIWSNFSSSIVSSVTGCLIPAVVSKLVALIGAETNWSKSVGSVPDISNKCCSNSTLIAVAAVGVIVGSGVGCWTWCRI